MVIGFVLFGWWVGGCLEPGGGGRQAAGDLAPFSCGTRAGIIFDLHTYKAWRLSQMRWHIVALPIAIGALTARSRANVWWLWVVVGGGYDESIAKIFEKKKEVNQK